MADEIAVTPTLDKEELARQNAEVIQKQAGQDLAGHSTAPGVELQTGSALDNLREAAIAQKKAEAGETPEVTPQVTPAVTPEVTPKPTGDTPPAEPTPDELAAKAKADADAELARQKEAQAAEARKQAEELFKGVANLPPNASPKSAEAFAAVKMRAAEQINELRSQVEELTKVKAELEVKASQPLTDEVKKELEDLRQFRARLDIETDPKWKQFDAKVSQDNEFIYAKLVSAGITSTTVEQIKAIGGPGNVKMGPILDAIKDPTTRSVVEHKLADIEMAAYQKQQAIEKAKEDVQKYQAERAKEWEQNAQAHNSATKAAIDNIVGKIPWLNKQPVDLKDETKRKAAEAHNQYAEAMRKELDIAASDDSAEMRATLLVGMVNLFRLQTAHNLLAKEHETLVASHTKEVSDLKATIDRLKAAGTNRLRTSGAPAGGGVPAPAAPSIHESAGDALDRLRAEKARASQS